MSVDINEVTRLAPGQRSEEATRLIEAIRHNHDMHAITNRVDYDGLVTIDEPRNLTRFTVPRPAKGKPVTELTGQQFVVHRPPPVPQNLSNQRFTQSTTPTMTLTAPTYQHMDIADPRGFQTSIFSDARDWTSNSTGIGDSQQGLVRLAGLYSRTQPLMARHNLTIPGGLWEGFNASVFGEHVTHDGRISVRMRWASPEYVTYGMFMSQPIQVAVLIHELAHRRYALHGPEFFQLYNQLYSEALGSGILDLTSPHVTEDTKYIVNVLHTSFTK